MKTRIIPILLAIATYADDLPSVKPIIEPLFAVTTKVEKDAYENGSTDNVDSFYGRALFGTRARLGDFSGEVAIFAYPAGFGYELMRGIQTPGDIDVLPDGTEKVARFDVHSAFIQHKTEVFTFGIGRNVLFNSNGAFFGNYIDEGPGGYFTGKGIYGNFMKFDFTYDIGSTSFTIGSDDSKINTGYLRLFQNFPIAEKANISLGMRTDLPNLVHSPDTTVSWNATAIVDYTINEKVKVYAEVGATSMMKDEKALVPVLAGVSFPAGKVFDAVAFEMEYLDQDQRLTIGHEGDMKQESSVMLGVDLKKMVR